MKKVINKNKFRKQESVRLNQRDVIGLSTIISDLMQQIDDNPRDTLKAAEYLKDIIKDSIEEYLDDVYESIDGNAATSSNNANTFIKMIIERLKLINFE